MYLPYNQPTDKSINQSIRQATLPTEFYAVPFLFPMKAILKLATRHEHGSSRMHRNGIT